MRSLGLKISVYVVQSVLPYFLSAWVLLTVVLFVQQASRYSDTFFNPNIPNILIWQLTSALLPGVIAFTCPMAVLVGILIGIGKMHSDKETIAIKAAGAGYAQIVLPLISLGLVCSIFAFFINWKLVPIASKMVRKVIAETALAKLESPIEPGSISTDIPNLTLYVRKGDIEEGSWKGIVVFRENDRSLVVSNEGYMLSGEYQVQLLLKNAKIISFPKGNIAVEKSDSVKIAIKNENAVSNLSKTEESLEELGLDDLYARTTQNAEEKSKEKLEAQILFNRRIVLSLAPLIFALLGSIIGITLKRGGKGTGVFLSLITLVIFYLFGFLGEQMARTGQLSPMLGSLMPIVVAPLSLISILRISEKMEQIKAASITALGKLMQRKGSRSVTPKLFDIDIIKELFKFYLLACSFLQLLFLVFTAFELWKFAGTMQGGTRMLLQYLAYLSPYIYLQLSPSCMMIASLAVIVIRSRQNELLALLASGQNIYRVVLIPCFLVALFIGFSNYLIQEKIAPETNKRQDALRNLIRQRGAVAVSGRFWINNKNYLMSLKTYERESQQGSDFYFLQFNNDEISSLFVSEKVKLLVSSDACKIQPVASASRFELSDNLTRVSDWNELSIEDFDPEMLVTQLKPSHMPSSEISKKIEESSSDMERRLYAVALQKRYLTLLLPLLAVTIAVPFVLMSYKSIADVGYSVASWIAFIGISNFFEQMALSGFISPKVAIWIPLLLFSALGVYFLSKART